MLYIDYIKILMLLLLNSFGSKDLGPMS